MYIYIYSFNNVYIYYNKIKYYPIQLIVVVFKIVFKQYLL